MSPSENDTAARQVPATRRLVPLQSFQNVLAGPSPNRMTPGVHWPDFENQTHARLWRGSRRVCTLPEIQHDGSTRITEPGLFVSMYDNHFGHMVAETIPRIPQSLAEAPELPLYFSARAGFGLANVSPMFRSVLGWLNVPLDQIRFIGHPTEFRDLTIAMQAEHLDGPPTAEDYLPLLEARIAGQLDMPRPEGIAFVSRAALAPEKGRHAGERYLADCLESLGVRVVYPENLTLHEQMKAYASAKYLVFSEGSALHGRQLLGRIDQHISILRRRLRSTIAQHQIAPRSASLTYVGSFGGSLLTTDADGRKIDHSMMSFYAVAPVIEHFESLGVPLRKVWDWAAYNRARDADVLAWVGAMYDPKVFSWLKPHNTDAYLLDQLEPLGLSHLRTPIHALIRLMRPEGTPASTPATKAQPAAAPGASDFAIRGEAGVDIFTRLEDVGANRPRYLCLATVVDIGGVASVQMHEPTHRRDARDLARLARAFAQDAALSQSFSLTDASAWPRAGHGESGNSLLQYAAFFLAWQEADAASQHFLEQLNRVIASLSNHPGALSAPVALLYNFNRISVGVQVARRVTAVLSQWIAMQQWPAGTRDSTGHAMRLLGDLCTRGAEPELALSCYEIALHAGDNGFRRRKAYEAARALGDRPKMELHLGALKRLEA